MIRFSAIDFIRSGTPPPNVPAAMWAWMWPVRVICGAAVWILLILLGLWVLIGLHMAGILELPPRTIGVLKHLAMPIAVICMLVLAIVPRVRSQSFTKRVRDCNYELCLRCGYWIRELPTLYKCPECGTKYEITQTLATWRKFLEPESNL